MAQFNDNFNTGNFDSWEGQVDDFEINAVGQLQLNAVQAGTSLIYHAVNFPDSAVWNFDINLKFSPSSNNKLTIFIASSDPSAEPLNGYVLSIGESGSEDAARFLHVTDGTGTELAAGISGNFAKAFQYNFELRKTQSDNWTLITTDLSSGSKLTEFELFIPDESLMEQMYFGFECQYTSSNVNNFWFDNIFINPIVPDLIGPEITSVSIVAAHELLLHFNENIEETSATNVTNYSFDPTLLIAAVEYNSNSPQTVRILLSDPLSSCLSTFISVENLLDISGNKMIAFSRELFFHEAPFEKGDLLINELLSNPLANGSDFIEIINPTTKSFNLKNIIVRNNDRDDEIRIEQDLFLGPGQIVALTNDTLNIKLTYVPPSESRIIEIDIPGYNNASGNASLINDTNGNILIIDSFDYNDDQHDDELLSDEGVSLERISLIEPTNNFNNWGSSKEKNNYASPGYINNISPLIQETSRIEIVNPQEIEIHFLDQYDQSSILNSSNYTVSNITVSDIMSDVQDGKTVVLFLQNELESGQLYTLNINGVKTACGRDLPDSSIEFRLIENAEQGDLLINEILFNPYPDEYDFVEIINTSDKFIRINNLNIKNAESGNEESVKLPGFISPGEILALTISPVTVTETYLPPSYANIKTQKLPPFNDDAGNVTLRVGYENTFVTIDSFDYNSDMHFGLLREEEGVSLERVSLISDSNEHSNWFSSAEINHFATPGYENSSRLIQEAKGEEQVYFSNQVFSPDGDGDKDILFINYNLDKAGYIGNVSLFDDSGRFEKTLASNELLSTEGFIRWDGTMSDGQIAPIGMYIVYYEFYHSDGGVLKGKKVCVLAQHLE